jgi:hypothetical protein
MEKIDRIVLRETKYIALWTVIFSVIMQAVFLIIGKWDVTVLLGNLLGGVAVILNFFLMGITVQKAVSKEEKEAKSLMRTSQTARLFMMFLFVVIGVTAPIFNTWSSIIPLVFPRIAMALKPIADKRSLNEGGDKTE